VLPLPKLLLKRPQPPKKPPRPLRKHLLLRLLPQLRKHPLRKRLLLPTKLRLLSNLS